MDAHRPIQHNLDDTFDMVGNQKVFKTPSANIAIAINELAKLPPSPVLNLVVAHLKAFIVQVNENRYAGQSPTLPL
jgi:hypothetical protein